MSSKKNTNIFVAAIQTITFLIILLTYSKMPDVIPIHWNFSGEVDGTGPKWMMWALFAIIVAANIIMVFAAKIDPRSDSYERHEKTFNIFRTIFSLFMAIILLAVIGVSTNVIGNLDMTKITLMGVGVIFLVLGNYMPKIKQNYTFGIKTPWTLESENVWNKTHRFSGVLYMITGVLFIAAPFIGGNYQTFLIFGAIIISAVLPMAYSYILFRREKEGK